MSWFKRLSFIVGKIIWYIRFARHTPGRIIKLERRHEKLASYIARQYGEIALEETIYKSDINTKEFSVYSQNGEDGILLYIFSKIGTTNRVLVEFGIGDGRECNAANLLINFGWSGLLMEISSNKADAARQYYDLMLASHKDKLQITQAQVQPDNINQLLQQHSISQQIDLLSIDIDGNDYWVWEAIEAINPRVVVIEYNASLGSEESLSVKYHRDFDRFKFHHSGYYHGASLLALSKLAQRKGYVLVGCDLSGVNAFFVKENIAQDKLPSLNSQQAYYPMYKREQAMSQLEQYALIESFGFEEIR